MDWIIPTCSMGLVLFYYLNGGDDYYEQSALDRYILPAPAM